MNKKVIEFNLNRRKKSMPDFRSGDVVRVHRKIKEGEKERVQIFEGMIIAIGGRQSSSPMITVRKVSNGVGVELIVPIYSPVIDKVELVKRAKIRKAKLYYIREKSAKSLRLKFQDMAEFAGVEEKKEEPTEEGGESEDASDDKKDKNDKVEDGEKKEEVKKEKPATEKPAKAEVKEEVADKKKDAPKSDSGEKK